MADSLHWETKGYSKHLSLFHLKWSIMMLWQSARNSPPNWLRLPSFFSSGDTQSTEVENFLWRQLNMVAKDPAAFQLSSFWAAFYTCFGCTVRWIGSAVLIFLFTHACAGRRCTGQGCCRSFCAWWCGQWPSSSYYIWKEGGGSGMQHAWSASISCALLDVLPCLVCSCVFLFFCVVCLFLSVFIFSFKYTMYTRYLLFLVTSFDAFNKNTTFSRTWKKTDSTPSPLLSWPQVLKNFSCATIENGVPSKTK